MTLIKVVGGDRDVKYAVYAPKSQFNEPSITLVHRKYQQKYDVAMDVKIGKVITEHPSRPVMAFIFRDGTVIHGRIPVKELGKLQTEIRQGGEKIGALPGDNTKTSNYEPFVATPVYHTGGSMIGSPARTTASSVFITIAIMCGLIVWAVSSCSSSSGPSAIAVREASIESKGVEAFSYCKMKVKETLKAPQSAKFPWMDFKVTTSTDQQTFYVTSYVDAQNGFGAMLRTNFQCELQYQGGGYDGWKLTDLSMF